MGELKVILSKENINGHSCDKNGRLNHHQYERTLSFEKDLIAINSVWFEGKGPGVQGYVNELIAKGMLEIRNVTQKWDNISEEQQAIREKYDITRPKQELYKLYITPKGYAYLNGEEDNEKNI